MQKKKILVISDHPLSSSGVGLQVRYLIHGLLEKNKYKFLCLGAAMKHENYNVTQVTPDFVIKPIDGFGNKEMIRILLAQEKPDAIFIFTDPRFFMHIFEMEDEIHQICPIVYWHLWDALPKPEFNKVLYESVDLINCINWPTYQFCKEWFPEKTNYIPHAIPKNVIFPLDNDKIVSFKKKVLKEKHNNFVGLWVSRNARRKKPSDVLESWKIFLDNLQEKHDHKNATLIMHTDPHDQEGPNLIHVVEILGLKDNVVFSRDRIDFNEMNHLFNITDFTLSISSNEGFGLSMLESMMCAKPIIAVKTGGMERQVVNHYDGTHNGIALDPDVTSLVGSQMVPYIYEHHVSNKKVANAIMEMYEYGPEKRQELGKKAYDYAIKEYNINEVVENWDKTLEKTINEWKSSYSRWSIEEIK